MFQIHCLNPISNLGLDNFSADYALVDGIDGAQGVLVRSAAMHDMELPTSLLAVARAGAGVNNIPLDDCAKKGVVVFNTPGANANGVKELVIAAMLLASRDIVGGINWAVEAKDDANIAKTTEKEKKNFAGTEIQGKTLGVIGLGAIGVLVANAAEQLGMKVLGYDPYLSVNAAWNVSRNIKYVTSLDEIYEACDFITVHVPAMKDTTGMIGADAIEKMKDGAVILNFARDILCDEVAVVAGLEANKLKAYVTDFPNPTTAGQKGCIVIPHLGASTEESEDNCAVMAVEEMMNYLENGNIINSVNYPNCDMGICRTTGRIAIFHQNSADMISKFTACIGNANINIAEFVNKSRGDVSYTMMDIDDIATDEMMAMLSKMDGVYKVRVVK
ncbi:MAG: 3-phosphoglycerate dehydrogenase family protein [Lachnospiraceae bacterium]